MVIYFTPCWYWPEEAHSWPHSWRAGEPPSSITDSRTYCTTVDVLYRTGLFFVASHCKKTQGGLKNEGVESD